MAVQSEREKTFEVGGERLEAGTKMPNDNELVGCISFIGFIG
jgi:hypothetical protein